MSRGHEQGGVRPVLVFSNNTSNTHSPILNVYPITSKMSKKRLPVHVMLKKEDSCLDCDSVILVEQPRTIDKSCIIKKLGTLTYKQQQQIAIAAVIQSPMIKMAFPQYNISVVPNLVGAY